MTSNDTTVVQKFFTEIEERSNFLHAPIDMDIICTALKFIIKNHHGQTRLSGEPYYHHPVEVARIISNYFCDTNIITAALLHDIVEDTNVSLNQLSLLFGDKVSALVDKLTKLDGTLMKLKLSDIESSYKLIQTNENEDDKPALTLKLADRLHNMRTIRYHSLIKQQKIAKETLVTFIPIASYVGATAIKLELEQIAINVLSK